MADARTKRGLGGWLSFIFSIVVALLGVALLAGGAQLLMLGGSPYYALAGLALAVSGMLLALRRPLGGLVYAVIVLVTVLWALWESGFAFWPLLPRVFTPAVGALVVLLLLFGLPRESGRKRALQAVSLSAVAGFGLMAAALVHQFGIGQGKGEIAQAAPSSQAQTGDWRYYGRDPGGSRFAPFTQIGKDNVDKLKVAWTFRTGEIADRGSEDQNTPLQVGDRVYVCTPKNQVIALDADTGKEAWRFNPKVREHFWNRCRGVGYYETAQARPTAQPAIQPATAAPATPLCARRIIATTINAQLIALDAATGQLCPTFGQGGIVNLAVGMGQVKPGYYFQTSTPTVAGDRIVIGGWVMDNRELNEPSGVVRAFSAETGELIWAWDLGNPAITKLPPEGQTYTRGTPNVWSTPAFDARLGLVYLPTGNATPDYWGSHRTPESERYSASVVALDIATGRERWRFQTVHHDLWDYDVPSQPMLIDFPSASGPIPALIQLTKRGQIFVLDRRNGAPLTRVEERPVPQGAEKGEWTYPTQPYSVGMPAPGAQPLSEKKMWGVTPFDQLYCRIAFKKLRYEGDFTPTGMKPSLQYPGNGGGMNWGSGAYDASTGRLVTVDMRMPITVRLVPAKRPGLNPASVPNRDRRNLIGVPYESQNEWLVSPLQVPCMQPPHGVLTAIDLKSRKVAWEVPLGSAETAGPLGSYSGLPIPLGTFGLGGPIATGAGLVFHASTADPYLRAYDTATGKVIWKDRLPVGVGGTPMTYVSPRTGRQYVAVSAGGARRMKERGDYIIAYALER